MQPGVQHNPTMDPLQDSALRALDAGGALTLVIDHVDDDDALCAALVCTTFRDTTFAQPRHGVRGAAEPHTGKRSINSVAGVASSGGRRGGGRRAVRG